MIKYKLIIGVIGASRNLDTIPNGNLITKIATELGEEITKRQHILLSGGKPLNNNPQRVHSAAMDGAKQAGKAGKPARLLSVLRDQVEYKIIYDADIKSKHLILSTAFGDERNFINGYVPDVLIAVQGGKGTLTEIAFAHLNQIPIIFIQNENIDTLKGLKKYTPILKKEAREILDQTKKQFKFDLLKLSKIDNFLNDYSNINSAASAKEAVDRAIKIAKRSVFNDLPNNNKLDELSVTYRVKLNELAKK